MDKVRTRVAAVRYHSSQASRTARTTASASAVPIPTNASTLTPSNAYERFIATWFCPAWPTHRLPVRRSARSNLVLVEPTRRRHVDIIDTGQQRRAQVSELTSSPNSCNFSAEIDATAISRKSKGVKHARGLFAWI